MMDILIWILIGGIAGWIAGQLMNSHGLPVTGNQIVDTVLTGIVGAVIGGFLLPLIGLSIVGYLGAIISAVIGAVVLIFVLRLLR